MTNHLPKLASMLAGCGVIPPMEDDCSPQGSAAHPSEQTAPAESPAKRPVKDKAGQRESHHRFRVLNAFVDFTAGGLPRSELLVWLALYRDTRDGIARTSQASLAQRTGLAKRTVCLAVDRLTKRGLLVVVRQGGLQRGPSSYRVVPLQT